MGGGRERERAEERAEERVGGCDRDVSLYILKLHSPPYSLQPFLLCNYTHQPEGGKTTLSKILLIGYFEH